MTIALGAASKAIAGNRQGPRLATPGAVLLFAGLALLWWGLGIFRGETSSNLGVNPVTGDHTDEFGKSGGASGSF